MKALVVLAVGCVVILVGPTAVAEPIVDEESVEIDMTSSPAPAGTIGAWGSSTGASPGLITVRSEVGLGIYRCFGRNNGIFHGSRSNGTVSGNWRDYHASSKCNVEMVDLSAQVELRKNGNVHSQTDTSFCRRCLFVKTPLKDSRCESCNGVWQLVSTHQYTFPAGYVIIDFDAGRCQLIDPLVVQCVKRSSKLRV